MTSPMRAALLLVLGLSFVACRAANARREAPPGYESRRFGPWGGEIFVPDGWKYREPNGPKGGMYIIAKEFAPDGYYDTGMRIQFIPGVKASGLTPQQAVAHNIKRIKETSKVLWECPPEQFGIFSRVCVETTGYPVKSKPKQEYRMISAFWWSDKLDMIAGVIFGAPVEEWEAVRRHYDISGNIIIYDADWVEAHRGKGPTTETSASATAPRSEPEVKASQPPPPQPDASLDPVVKLGSIQFVNKMDDLEWRLGTNPEALIVTIEAMRRTIAEQLKAWEISQPAVVNAMLGFAPKGRFRVWLIGWDGILPPDKQRALAEKLEGVRTPEVRNGPVALSVRLALNGAELGEIDPADLRFPDEWRDATQGESVQVPDGLPDSVWTPKAK